MAMTEEQLEAFGEQVTIITERLGEMANALDIIVSSQSQIAKSASDAKAKTDSLAAAADKSGRALENKAKIEQEVAQEQKKRENAREAAENNAISSLASFGDALLSTEQGFGKFSGSLGSAGDAAFELGKSFGLLGTVLGAIVKVGTSVGEMFLKQADAQNNFVTEVYKMGGISGQSSEKLTDLAREAGYSAGELDKLTPSLKAAGRGLATLGTSTGDGTTALLKLFNVGNETEKEFFRLGYTLDELNKTQADYIELQRISGINLRARGVDEDKLKKQSLDYAKNLRELSDLTGKSAETLQQEQAAAQSAYENVVANRQDEARIRQMQTELDNETNTERRAQLEREITELENAGRVRNEAIGAMANTLGKDFGEQFGRILRTGTFDELTGPLANLFSQAGLDPADIKSRFEGVEAGSDEFNALVADIQGNLRSGIDSSLLMLGDSIQFGGREMGEAFGLAAELIENSAVIDPDGQIQQARAQAIQNEIDSTMQAGDAQRDYAAATESFTRDMRVTADAMLDAMNPLTGEMDLLKGTMTALAVAVGAATIALAAMAARSGLNAIRTAGRGSGGRGPGGADDLLDDTRRGSGLGRVFKGATRLVGKAALPLAVGMTAYDAYKGFTADPNASMSERFGNAGSSALSGLTFGLAGSDPNEIAARSTGEPATPDVPSARELRIATERENNNRRIQLAREGHSRSEIEAMMAEDRASNIQADVSAAVSEPVVPTVRPTEETPALPEVPSARPISELTTSEEFSEERNRLDQLVQQNTITRQEQLDLLGELRDRERELAEAAYQARQLVGPPVPTAVPTAAPVPVPTARPTEETPAPPEVPIARTPDESEPVTANVSTSENYEQRLAELSEKYYNDDPPIAPTESLKQEARRRANLKAREELQKEIDQGLLQSPRDRVGFTDNMLNPEPQSPVTARVTVPELPDTALPVTANVAEPELPDTVLPVTARVTEPESPDTGNYEQRLAELTDQYFNESVDRNPINGSTESLKQKARQAANLRARAELQKEIDQGLLQRPRDRVGFTDDMLTPQTQTPDEITSLTTPAAPTVTQAAPRALAPAIETPTPAQVTTAITPAPVVQPTQSTTPVVTTTTTAQANNANANTDINDIMTLLSYKLDNVISLLETGVTIQDRILLESRS
jgi:hypothetical protein